MRSLHRPELCLRPDRDRQQWIARHHRFPRVAVPQDRESTRDNHHLHSVIALPPRTVRLFRRAPRVRPLLRRYIPPCKPTRLEMRSAARVRRQTGRLDRLPCDRRRCNRPLGPLSLSNHMRPMCSRHSTRLPPDHTRAMGEGDAPRSRWPLLQARQVPPVPRARCLVPRSAKRQDHPLSRCVVPCDTLRPWLRFRPRLRPVSTGWLEKLTLGGKTQTGRLQDRSGPRRPNKAGQALLRGRREKAHLMSESRQ